jgi:hypothetical protein
MSARPREVGQRPRCSCWLPRVGSRVWAHRCHCRQITHGKMERHFARTLAEPDLMVRGTVLRPHQSTQSDSRALRRGLPTRENRRNGSSAALWDAATGHGTRLLRGRLGRGWLRLGEGTIVDMGRLSLVASPQVLAASM